jgi:carbamoyltransferase
VKKSSDFPVNAIRYCLAEAGVTPEEVDYYAIPWEFDEEGVIQTAIKILRGPGTLTERFHSVAYTLGNPLKLFSHEYFVSDFNKRMGTNLKEDKFIFIPHHLTHMMCGFFLSGYQDSAFLITDGRAELSASEMGEISKDGFSVFPENTRLVKDSLGLLYRKFTRYLGYVPNCDEYKVMALAAFTKSPPEYDYSKFIELQPGGNFEIKIQPYDEFIPYPDAEESYYPFFREFFGERNEQNDIHAAYFVQHLTEEAIWHQVKYLQEKTQAKNLLIEGGVAMNCVNNGKILRRSRFENVYVGFAANDAGVAIGAAFFPFYQAKIFPDVPVTAYLGPAYSRQDMLDALNAKASALEFKELDEAALMEAVTDELNQKKIIGWFQDRMEYGPRALGNRSILASPVFDDMKDIINHKVKFREGYRPFAGVILESEADNYFEMGKKRISPYMTFVFDSRPDKRNKLTSALHADDTSRIQTVNAQQNPKLHKLLETFMRKTGSPCIINTSFNVQGEPIVCAPHEAVNCFLNSGIDVLVLGPFIAYKK